MRELALEALGALAVPVVLAHDRLRVDACRAGMATPQVGRGEITPRQEGSAGQRQGPGPGPRRHTRHGLGTGSHPDRHGPGGTLGCLMVTANSSSSSFCLSSSCFFRSCNAVGPVGPGPCCLQSVAGAAASGLDPRTGTTCRLLRSQRPPSSPNNLARRLLQPLLLLAGTQRRLHLLHILLYDLRRGQGGAASWAACRLASRRAHAQGARASASEARPLLLPWICSCSSGQTSCPPQPARAGVRGVGTRPGGDAGTPRRPHLPPPRHAAHCTPLCTSQSHIHSSTTSIRARHLLRLVRCLARRGLLRRHPVLLRSALGRPLVARCAAHNQPRLCNAVTWGWECTAARWLSGGMACRAGDGVGPGSPRAHTRQFGHPRAPPCRRRAPPPSPRGRGILSCHLPCASPVGGPSVLIHPTATCTLQMRWAAGKVCGAGKRCIPGEREKPKLTGAARGKRGLPGEARLPRSYSLCCFLSAICAGVRCSARMPRNAQISRTMQTA